MSNVRLHLNAWHTNRRYQIVDDRGCKFCLKGHDSLEHFFKCPSISAVLPAILKVNGIVPVQTWLLKSDFKQHRLLMALYIHALYNVHNMYRNKADRQEFRQTVENLVLGIPLKPKLQAYIRQAVNPYVWY